jgi:hypothetical protein
MSVQIVRNEVPQHVQQQLAKGISTAIGSQEGLWVVDITSESEANAWDVEVVGPDHFHWGRRFSGEDRDTEVIVEAIRQSVFDRAA